MFILNDLKEKFNERPIIIKILFILLIISFIYEIIGGVGSDIIFAVILLLLLVSEFLNWFLFTKE